MKIANLPRGLVAATLLLAIGHTVKLRAQAASPAVASISQALSFAVTGTVTSTAGPVQVQETPISGTSAASAPVVTVPQPVQGAVKAGSQIATATGAAASLVMGEVGTARLNEESEVRLPAQGETGHSLEVLKGLLFLEVSGENLKKTQSEFRLKTPAALLAVKGTRFFSRTENGADLIGVHEGSVVVTEPKSGRSVTVETGFAVSVKEGELGELRKLEAGEVAQEAEYAKARVRRVALPNALFEWKGGRWVDHKWMQKVTFFRDGKKVTEDFEREKGTWPEKYIRLIPSATIGGSQAITMSNEGYFRLSWRDSEGKCVPRHTLVQLESMRWLKASGGKPSAQIIGLRFRYRGLNIASGSGMLTGRSISRSNVPNLRGIKAGSQASPTMLEIPLGTGWAEVLIAGRTVPLDGEADLLLCEWLAHEHKDIRFPTPPTSVVDMTDFEVLLSD